MLAMLRSIEIKGQSGTKQVKQVLQIDFFLLISSIIFSFWTCVPTNSYLLFGGNNSLNTHIVLPPQCCWMTWTSLSFVAGNKSFVKFNGEPRNFIVTSAIDCSYNIFINLVTSKNIHSQMFALK